MDATFTPREDCRILPLMPRIGGKRTVVSSSFFLLLGLWIGGPAVHAEPEDRPAPDPASIEAEREGIDVASTVLLPSAVRLPSHFDPAREYDLLVALHGFGSSPEGFAEISRPFTEANLVFAAPQAPTPFLVEGNLGFDWDRAHDEPDGSERRVRFGRASVDYIVDVIETLQDRYAIRHVYLFGFSQGGAYAYLVGIHHPDLVSGVAAVGMGFDVVWFEDGALESASGVPVLIAHSPSDQRIPIVLARESAETLRSLGYDVTFYEYSDGHRVTQDVLEQTVRWIEHLDADPETSNPGSKAAAASTEQ